MKYVYLLPFTYFFDTRLREGSIAFHFIFEWLAAVVLVVLLGDVRPVQALVAMGLSYIAFISLYEIGYLVNDLFASHNETDGRQRGPQDANGLWMGSWCVVRLMAFILATNLIGKLSSPEWWTFFVALGVVFALHNGLRDRELKAATFLWLAWFRFMAPVIFVVQDSQLLGIGLAAAMAYASFRLFGYLDSKGLLQMPGRQRSSFRLFFFLMPLAGALALWPYESARGFLVLTGYYVLAAVLGIALNAARKRSVNNIQGQ